MPKTKNKTKNKTKTKYGYRYKKTINYKLKYKYTKTNQINRYTNKQKKLRIILGNSPSLENDANTYKNEFLKQGYKVDISFIKHIFHKNIYHDHIENYYDVNLFLEFLPYDCKYNFPSKTNLFMPNNELFIYTKEDNEKYSKKDKYGKSYTYNRYEELKNIDYILCKTEICQKFFNFIKNEKYKKHKYKYKYQTIYTKFTTNIDTKIKQNIDDENNNTLIDPNLFIHLAGKSPYKNTSDLVLCWINNKGFLDIDPDIKLVITCYEDCSYWFNMILKKIYKYDFNKDPDVIMNHKNNIANYKNMTIHFKSINPFSDFIDIISKANVAICISNKEGYGHYINEARYMKKFIITMDYPPMNELIIDKDDNIEGGNGILLKKKNKFIKKNFKATKFNFTEAYPDFDELRDSIIWCIKHKHELRKWGKNGNKMFMNDKKYFEDIMDKFIKSKL